MVRHRRAWAPVLTRRQRLAGHLGCGVEEAGGQGPARWVLVTLYFYNHLDPNDPLAPR
jgi:hypothetical protein